MDRDVFVGTWRLVAFALHDAAGNVQPAMGPDGKGYIVYTRDGHVFVTIQTRRATDFVHGDIGTGTEAEILAAYRVYNSYVGTYEVRGDQVIHHVELSLFPNWIGEEQARFYKFEGERLLLSAAPTLVRGVEMRAHLVWERVATV